MTVIIQEGIALKPGYVLNPYEPLYGIDEPDDPIAMDIYHSAMEVDGVGGSADFQADFEYWENQIQLNNLSWVKTGQIAYRIKLTKAWDSRYSSFKECCEAGFRRSAAYINNCIRGFLVISNLIANRITIFPNLTCAIELSKLNAQVMLDEWRRAITQWPPHQINLERLRSLMSDPFNKKPPKKRVEVDLDDWEILRETAANAGISPKQMLKQFIRGGSEPESIVEAIAFPTTPVNLSGEEEMSDDEPIDEYAQVREEFYLGRGVLPPGIVGYEEAPEYDDNDDIDPTNDTQLDEVGGELDEVASQLDENAPLSLAERAKRIGRIKDVFVSNFLSGWAVVQWDGLVLPLAEWLEVF